MINYIILICYLKDKKIKIKILSLNKIFRGRNKQLK